MIRTPPECALVLLQCLLKRSQEQAHDNVAGQAAGTATSFEPSIQDPAVQKGHEHVLPGCDRKTAAQTARKRSRAVAAEQAVQHSLDNATAAAAEPEVSAAKRSKPINQDKLLSGLMRKAQKRAAVQHKGTGRGAGPAVQQKPAHAGTHATQTAIPQQQQQQQQQQLPHKHQQQRQRQGSQQQGNTLCMGGSAQTYKPATGTAAASGIAGHGSASLAAAADALEQALARQGSCMGKALQPATAAAAGAAAGAGSATSQQLAPEGSDSGGSGDAAGGTEYADLEALWNAELQSSSIPAVQAAPQHAAADEQSQPALQGEPADMQAVEAATSAIPEDVERGTDTAAAPLINGGSVPADTGQQACNVYETATAAAYQHQAADTGLMGTNAAAAAEADGMEEGVAVSTVSAAVVPSDARQQLQQGGAVAMQQEGLWQQQQQETQHHWQQQHLRRVHQQEQPQQQLQWVHQQEQQQRQPLQSVHQQEQHWQHEHWQQHVLPEQQQQQQQQEAHQHTADTPAGSQAPTAAAAAAVVLVPAPAQRFTLAELLFAVPELPIKAAPATRSKQAAQAAQGHQPAASHSGDQSLPPAAAAAAASATGGGRIVKTSAAAGGEQSSFAKQQLWQGQLRRPQQQQHSARAQAQQLQQQHQGFGPQQLSQPAESLQQHMTWNVMRVHSGVTGAVAAANADANASSSDEEGELNCSDTEAAPTNHPTAAQVVFTFIAGPGPATPAAADGAAASQQCADAQAATAAAVAAGGGGGSKRAKKSRAGKKVRLRRAEAQRDAAAAAAGGGGDVKLGLYAEIKAWEKEQAAKARKAGAAPVDAARELRFSITGKAPCKFWQAGRCSKGEACPYLHAGQPAVQLVACKFHQRGACRAGDSCKFSHAALAELPCPELALYHKCTRQTGACPYQHDALDEEVALALRRLLMKMQQQQEESAQQQLQQQGAQAGVPAGSRYQAQHHQAVPMPHQQQQAGLQHVSGCPGQQYHAQEQMQSGVAGGHIQQWQQPQAHMQLQQPHMMQPVPAGVTAVQQHPGPPVALWSGAAAQQHMARLTQLQQQQQQQQLPMVPSMQQWGSGLQRRG